MAEYKTNDKLKFLLTSQDKIAVQLKLMEMRIKQTDMRLFKSTMEDDLLFQVHNLQRKSVLEGVAKMLIKIKEENDKKIEEVSSMDNEADNTLDQSINTSFLDNSSSQSDWTSHLNLKMDKYAGPMTQLFLSSRSV